MYVSVKLIRTRISYVATTRWTILVADTVNAITYRHMHTPDHINLICCFIKQVLHDRSRLPSYTADTHEQLHMSNRAFDSFITGRGRKYSHRQIQFHCNHDFKCHPNYDSVLKTVTLFHNNKWLTERINSFHLSKSIQGCFQETIKGFTVSVLLPCPLIKGFLFQ